jgi:hypothetical protein
VKQKVMWYSGLTILKLEMCLGIVSACRVDPVVSLRLKNIADYHNSQFWVIGHQTRAFLISMKNEKRFSGWFDNAEKGDVSGHCERLQG